MKSNKNNKTLILYTTHEDNENVQYFIHHGLTDNILETCDVIFCMNETDIQLPARLQSSKVRKVLSTNDGYDFGGWSTGLFASKLDDYHYFFFINSSVRGPFLPQWAKKLSWINLFKRLLDSDCKLAGSTLGFVEAPHALGQPYIQSADFILSREGLDLAINEGIFTPNIVKLTKDQTVIQKEEKLSAIMLKRGWNLRCLLKAFHGADFRKSVGDVGYNPYRPQNYYGTDVHPYEVIFVKTSKWASGSAELAKIYSHWHDDSVHERQALISQGTGQLSPILFLSTVTILALVLILVYIKSSKGRR